MLLLLLASLVWAFSFGLIKGQLAGVDPTAVAVLRLLCALLVFLPFLRRRQLSRRAQLRLAAIGAVQFGLMYILYLHAFAVLQAYEVALFTIFTPIYLALLDAALEHRWEVRHLLAAVLSLGGAGVLLWRTGVGSGAVGGFILVLFLAVYIAAEPDLYKRGLLLLVSPPTRRRLEPVLTAIAAKLRRWLGTQALAMLIIGTVTTILLSIIGVRAALPLGLIAGILEFIPNVGPTLAAIPAIVMAFVDSPQKALVVMIVYWGIQFLENNLLIPYLMREQLDLPPALTLMTQVVMAYVFGLMGLFVATPLLAAVFVTVQMLHVQPDPVPRETGTGTGDIK